MGRCVGVRTKTISVFVFVWGWGVSFGIEKHLQSGFDACILFNIK